MNLLEGLIIGGAAADSGEISSAGIIVLLWFLLIFFILVTRNASHDGDPFPFAWNFFLGVSFCALLMFSYVTFRTAETDQAVIAAKAKPYEEFVSADGKQRQLNYGDTHEVVYHIRHLVAGGGYVGTGPAEEVFKGVTSYTFPGDHLGVGWNGLPITSGTHYFHLVVKSVFGEEFDVLVPTRYTVEVTLISPRGRKVWSPHLTTVTWEGNKVNVRAAPTTWYLVRELDKQKEL